MSENVYESLKIGKKLRLLREKYDMTQEYMANELEISISGYSRIERDEVKLSIDKLIKVCKIMNLEIDDLIYRSDTEILSEELYESDIDRQFKPNKNAQILQELYEKQIKFLNDELKYLKDILDKKMPT
jgi:transcriptional regulator with XRE-family HTH domain